MGKLLGAMLLGAVMLGATLGFSRAASAGSHKPQWFVNRTHAGRGLECDEDGDGAVAGPFATLAECQSALVGGGGGGGGGTASTGTAASQGPSSFLCYYAGGDMFVAGPGQAEQLEAEGLWLPTAVAGTVPGGTNIGNFHLVCREQGRLGVNGNAPAAKTYADGGGGTIDYAAAAASHWVGVYPIEQAAGS